MWHLVGLSVKWNLSVATETTTALCMCGEANDSLLKAFITLTALGRTRKRQERAAIKDLFKEFGPERNAIANRLDWPRRRAKSD